MACVSWWVPYRCRGGPWYLCGGGFRRATACGPRCACAGGTVTVMLSSTEPSESDPPCFTPLDSTFSFAIYNVWLMRSLIFLLSVYYNNLIHAIRYQKAIFTPAFANAFDTWHDYAIVIQSYVFFFLFTSYVTCHFYYFDKVSNALAITWDNRHKNSKIILSQGLHEVILAQLNVKRSKS